MSHGQRRTAPGASDGAQYARCIGQLRCAAHTGDASQPAGSVPRVPFWLLIDLPLTNCFLPFLPSPLSHLGDYSLEISPVALEDDAVFQCQVGALDGVHGIRSRSAAFTVQVPPEAPVIVVTHAHSHAQVYKSTENATSSSSSSPMTSAHLQAPSGASELLVSTSLSGSSSPSNDHHLRTTAGMTIELTCEAHGGRPPAEVSPTLVPSFTHSFHSLLVAFSWFTWPCPSWDLVN